MLDDARVKLESSEEEPATRTPVEQDSPPVHFAVGEMFSSYDDLKKNNLNIFPIQLFYSGLCTMT